jgi:exonuclease SbcC
VQAGAGRRRALATIDAAEAARALLAETTRLEAEQAALGAAQAAAALQLQRALAAQQQAALALAAAAAQLQAAETRQRAAAPQLDRAKALDASIAALAPAHQAAAAALENAGREAALARDALQAKAGQLAQTRAAHQAGQAWLAAHRRREALATQWPRWDQLFGQAEQAAALELSLAAALVEAQAAAQQAAAQETAAAALLATAAEQLQGAQASRQQAQLTLAAFDPDQLRRARQALEMRRDSLAGAASCWNELLATRRRLQQAEAQAVQLGSANRAAQQALALALAGAPALAAAAEQAERSLNAAELACAGSVEDLRATLADGQPCPVCGSAQHPYQHQNARLHALLTSLRAELESCRATLRENLSAQAAQRALADSGEQQLAALARERTALDQALAACTASWDTHALAAEAPAEAQRSSWLAAELEALKTQSNQLDALEQSARHAALARDAAQEACDQAASGHARQQQLAAAAGSALAQANASCHALTEKRAQAAGALASLLGELDAAFDAGWQDQWRRGPAPFRAARAGEAQEWNEQSLRHAARAASLGALEAEHAAAAGRLEHAEKTAAQAQAGFAGIDADIGAKQGERRALWEGRPVAELELAFAAAIEAAKAALAQQQGASGQAADAETRAREALAHGSERIDAIGAASAAAIAALAAWLQDFARRHPDLDPLADRAALAALLARDPGSIALERSAQGAVDARAAGAQVVLAERRAQCEQHLLDPAAPPADAPPAEQLAAALAVLQDERKAAHDAATALRLQLAQDQARRHSAQSMMAALDKQQLVERRWGRLSELIGSSDGKKFRNYAQQFTLDLLLGYANSHLAQLARRYRLERVANPAGPSLGLMVRDQDMGGEVRSVNSLSGGESFLVSLALALGLASLSSNRVRVESLFIDEGFGSLDSETLRVAMDALDGLQSMGRKVGVISHVQEMTERIATRIVVQPSGAGSSSVTVQ